MTTEDTRDVPSWYDIAEHELGIQEVAGVRANPRIVEYLKTTTLPVGMQQSDETPWCSAFVNWCMEKSEHAGTGLANARSWLTWGQPLKLPQRGAVMVFSRGDNALAGHVTFFVESIDAMTPGEQFYRCLGGNQQNNVCVKLYPKARLLGIRWPNT